MEPRTLKFITDACGGVFRGVSGTDALCWTSRVSTDTRTLRAGDLFVAVRGETFDGHKFLNEAQERGAVAALIDSAAECATENHRLATIQVEDTRRAMGQVAAAYRGAWNKPMIAIAGSNGKTTTKELVACVLASSCCVAKSPESFNNDIGVPLTLLEIESRHDVAVLEVGTNHPGELRPLLEWVRPQYGVLTNIGHEHLEFFEDLEGVAREEGVLAEILPEDGWLVVGGDSPCIERVTSRSRAVVLRVGLSENNDWRVRVVSVGWDGTVFRLEGGCGAYEGEYKVPVAGRMIAVNAGLALAVASLLGVEHGAAREALTTFVPPKQRFHWWQQGGVRVIDDTYNANVDSMKAALQTLSDLPCSGRRVAVLGDMAELGGHTEAAHVEVGHFCSGVVDVLFAVGKHASRVVEVASGVGVMASAFESADAVGRTVLESLKPGDVVLVKGSRSGRLERVVQALRTGLQDRKEEARALPSL